VGALRAAATPAHELLHAGDPARYTPGLRRGGAKQGKMRGPSDPPPGDPAPMYAETPSMEQFDSDLFQAILDETRRQEEHIELIASENDASPRVLEAQGSVLTNKYAEGYPGKRYYGGCEYVDVVESLAIERAKELFGAAYANVQPHSGSQ